MSKAHRISGIGVLALLAAGFAAGPLAQPLALQGPIAIRIMPQSQQDAITPKAGARLSDQDGLQVTDGEVVITPFTLRALIGGDRVEVSVPELHVDQLIWVADPVGCEDNDPKTKCHPTWGAEYAGQVAVDLPVHVEFASGGVGFSDYGVVSLLLTVTVIDDRVRGIEGAVQITYSTTTNLPNYRIPIVGKLK